MSTQLATCPACGLRNIPVTNGQLAAHAWYPWIVELAGGPEAEIIDGPLDAEGNPTPGEWSGGCQNRELSTSNNEKI